MWAKNKGWIVGLVIVLLLIAAGLVASRNIDSRLAELRGLVKQAIQAQSDAREYNRRAEEWYTKTDSVLAGIENDSKRNRLESEQLGKQFRESLLEIRQDVGRTGEKLSIISGILEERRIVDERSNKEAGSIRTLIEQYAKDHGINLSKPDD